MVGLTDTDKKVPEKRSRGKKSRKKSQEKKSREIKVSLITCEREKMVKIYSIEVVNTH